MNAKTPTPEHRAKLAGAADALAGAKAKAADLRARAAGIGEAAFDDANLRALRLRIADMAAAAALGSEDAARELKAARQSLAAEEARRDAHEAATAEVREGVARMLAATDADVAVAQTVFDAALREWLDHEAAAADRRYAEAVISAETDLRRTFALVALARRRGLTLAASACADYAEEFVAPSIGEASRQQAEGYATRDPIAGTPMRRVSRYHLKRSEDDQALHAELLGIVGSLE
jgi:hypothetical protein